MESGMMHGLSPDPLDLSKPDDVGSMSDSSQNQVSAPRILVADDDVVFQMVLADLLTNAGYAVDVVSDGRAAIDALLQVDYALLLLDRRMPGMDGLSAARAIRGRQFAVLNSRVPIIALTAVDSADDLAECLEAGVTEQLSKPLDPDLLLAAVQRCLAIAADGAGTTPGNAAAGDHAASGPGEKARPAGAADFTDRLVERFLEDIPDIVTRLEQAITCGNVAEIERISHKFRGTASVVGASRLAARACELELASKNGDLEQSTTLALQLVRELQKLTHAMMGT